MLSRRPRHVAFTLVELLVVIGIIALLISILLPALGSANRQAKATQCLSNLRQIGQAFALYEQTYKGAWPVVVHGESAQGHPFFPSGHGDRVWLDFLAPFLVGKKGIDTRADLQAIRDSYDKFACPAYERKGDKDPFYFANSLGPSALPGYAMHYHPSFYEELYYKGPLQASVAHAYPGMALIHPNATVGRYVRGDVWKRRGSERGVVTDADGWIIFTIDQFAPGTTGNGVNFQPFIVVPPGGYTIQFTRDFVVNAIRHARPGTTKRQAYKVKGMNILYADGHAGPVTVGEAWNAIHNPGRDRIGKVSSFY
jgi:prepilin-type processing-associated H-X9-DG protein